MGVGVKVRGRRYSWPAWYIVHRDRMREEMRAARADPAVRARLNEQARERRQRPGRKEREAELRALRKARAA